MYHACICRKITPGSEPPNLMGLSPPLRMTNIIALSLPVTYLVFPKSCLTSRKFTSPHFF